MQPAGTKFSTASFAPNSPWDLLKPNLSSWSLNQGTLPLWMSQCPRAQWGFFPPFQLECHPGRPGQA